MYINSSSTADWSARVQQLLSAKKYSPKEIFTSDEMSALLYRKAESFVVGTCRYLRSIGFDVSPAREQKVIQNLMIEVSYDTNENSATASAASTSQLTSIMLNAGNELISSIQDIEDQYSALCGFLYHELGHVLFSSFPTLKAYMNSIERGVWFPTKPKGLATQGGLEITDAMAGVGPSAELKDVIPDVAKHINNSLEDGYIENEVVTMYPGFPRQALATLNTQLIAKSKAIADRLDEKEVHIASAMLEQMLLYAKFGFMMLDKCPAEYEAVLIDMCEYLDDARIERDPNKRMEITNELLIQLFPYIDEEFKEQQQQQKQSPQSAARGIQSRITQIVSALGIGTPGGDSSTTESITNLRGVGQNGNASSKTNSSVSGMPGARAGESDKSAAKRELKGLTDTMRKNAAQATAQKEYTNQLNKNSQCETSDCTVTRAAKVSQENIRSYNRHASEYERIASDTMREIKEVLKDRREGGRRKNLYMGRRFEVAHWCTQDDAKDFSKIKWPTESPTLGFGLLIDESGSTAGECIEAAMQTAIVLELFASKQTGLDIKHIISGYTTGSNDCQIFAYSEPVIGIDNDDVYRITGMQARAGTPTVAAMQWMTKRLEGLNTDIKLMIVISDGGAGDNDMVGNTTKIKAMIEENKKSNIITIAAGIGSARAAVEREFGKEHYLDVSDLTQMPQQLAQIVKDNLWV